MTINERLDDLTRAKLGVLVTDGINHHPVANEHSRANCERLTRREWESVMGMDRDRYRRVNGKVKRK